MRLDNTLAVFPYLPGISITVFEPISTLRLRHYRSFGLRLGRLSSLRDDAIKLRIRGDLLPNWHLAHRHLWCLWRFDLG